MKKYDRYYIWVDRFGNKTPVWQMDDTHILNCVQFVMAYVNIYGCEMVDMFVEEANRRGLTITREPIPYKGPDGRTYVWDFEKRCEVEV